jgi:hypothetical protein
MNGGEKLSFIRKTTPPPDVEEGDILKAKILDIKKETSKWKNDDGTDKEQLKFDLELENGYKTNAWISYYDHPGDRSAFAKLTLKLCEMTKKDVSNASEATDALKKYGWVFAKVKSFREYEGETYPNFSIVTEKLPALPATQQKIETKEPEPEIKQFDAKQLLSQFKEAIDYGLPLNIKDWTKNLLVGERLFLLKQGFLEKNKEDQELYFFTDKARTLFQQ